MTSSQALGSYGALGFGSRSLSQPLVSSLPCHNLQLISIGRMWCTIPHRLLLCSSAAAPPCLSQHCKETPPSSGNTGDLSKIDVERANPSLKFIKTDLHSTISQSHLKKVTSLLLLFIDCSIPCVPKLWSIASQDHSLAGCCFLILLPIPEN